MTAHCPSCRRMTRYVRPRTNHVLHLLLSVLTLGLWIPVWLIVAGLNGSKPARCSICGTFGTGPATSPAGWHPDPYGRAVVRYWDGQGWTDHVAE